VPASARRNQPRREHSLFDKKFKPAQIVSEKNVIPQPTPEKLISRRFPFKLTIQCASTQTDPQMFTAQTEVNKVNIELNQAARRQT
jgi:hypothetical protein